MKYWILSLKLKALNNQIEKSNLDLKAKIIFTLQIVLVFVIGFTLFILLCLQELRKLDIILKLLMIDSFFLPSIITIILFVEALVILYKSNKIKYIISTIKVSIYFCSIVLAVVAVFLLILCIVCDFLISSTIVISYFCILFITMCFLSLIWILNEIVNLQLNQIES